MLVWLAACALTATASAAVPSWTTYRHDDGRSGIDPDSASPTAPAQVWQTGALDGLMWSQPLVYGSRVYVATENDTVYALDAATGSVVWQRHLATPVPSGKLPCGNISPVVGITSTPVIDAAAGRIFVVGDTWDGTNIRHELFGLNLSDGSVAVGPEAVDPPGSIPANQLQRASLALDAGKVIIGEGGNDGDCGTYHGWLIAVPESGGSLQTFEVDGAAGENEGAIWAAGNAPPIDSSGNVWTSTGNGQSASFDYQESVIKLDSNLKVLDHWAPSNWATLDSSDGDLGSSMPVLLPGGLVFEMGKSGVGYLLSASNLGGTGGTPVYQASSVCSGSWGGGIFVNGVIYVTCSNGVHALSLNTTARTFTALPGWTVNSNAVGPPIYAGGQVWSAGTGNGVLYALDPASGATRYSANLGSFEHFTTPSAGGGRLFVANGDTVTGFQIATPPGATATTTALASSATPVLAGRPVKYTATVSPVPDGGSFSFTDGGRPIAGCAGVPVGSGQASCTTAYGAASRHAIAAVYLGDSYYGASGAALTQVVTAITPVISRLKATTAHRRLRLAMTISTPARLTVTVYRLRRCGRSHRRTCRQRVRRLTLPAHTGPNHFRPRMHALAPGRYLVTIAALTPSGGRSRMYRTTCVVRARRP